MKTKFSLLLAALAMMALLPAANAQTPSSQLIFDAPYYSVDGATSASGTAGDEIWNIGGPLGVGGTPIPPAGPGTIEVNALSFGRYPTPFSYVEFENIFFSVGPVPVAGGGGGLAGSAVAVEYGLGGPGEAAGDVFVTNITDPGGAFPIPAGGASGPGTVGGPAPGGGGVIAPPVGVSVAAAAQGGAVGGLGGTPAAGLTGLGTNFQVFDGDGVAVGLTPPPIPYPAPGFVPPPNTGFGTGLGNPEGAMFEDIDGLDVFHPLGIPGPGAGNDIYYSTAPGAGPFGAGAPGADIFFVPGPPGPGYSGAGGPIAGPTAGVVGDPIAALFGITGGTDIDALEYIDDGAFGFTGGDLILFSLAPGDPALGFLGMDPASSGGGVGPPASAADIFIASLAGGLVAPNGALGGLTIAVFASAAELGLLPGDNLNALSLVPEPSRLVFLALGLTGLLLRRRRPAIPA